MKEQIESLGKNHTCRLLIYQEMQVGIQEEGENIRCAGTKVQSYTDGKRVYTSGGARL